MSYALNGWQGLKKIIFWWDAKSFNQKIYIAFSTWNNRWNELMFRVKILTKMNLISFRNQYSRLLLSWIIRHLIILLNGSHSKYFMSSISDSPYIRLIMDLLLLGSINPTYSTPIVRQVPRNATVILQCLINRWIPPVSIISNINHINMFMARLKLLFNNLVFIVYNHQ